MSRVAFDLNKISAKKQRIHAQRVERLTGSRCRLVDGITLSRTSDAQKRYSLLIVQNKNAGDFQIYSQEEVRALGLYNGATPYGFRTTDPRELGAHIRDLLRVLRAQGWTVLRREKMTGSPMPQDDRWLYEPPPPDEPQTLKRKARNDWW